MNALYKVRVVVENVGDKYEYYVRAMSAKKAIEKALTQGFKDARVYINHKGVTVLSLERLDYRVL